MTRLPILTLTIILLVQAITPQAIAATSETCTSQGVKYNCVTERVEVQSLRPVYGSGLAGVDAASEVLTFAA